MNGNLKALKKILFILQKSCSGLEHKLVIWDSLTNCKQEAARVTALLPLEEAKLLRGSRSQGRVILWALYTRSKAKERTLCFRSNLKTFIQASRGSQSPQLKGIKLYWSLAAGEAAFWMSVNPVPEVGTGEYREGICSYLKILFQTLDSEDVKFSVQPFHMA